METKITHSCGNIFRDIGVPDAALMLDKSRVVMKIEQKIKQLNLTNKQASKILNIPLETLKMMFRGSFREIKLSKLKQYLTILTNSTYYL